MKCITRKQLAALQEFVSKLDNELMEYDEKKNIRHGRTRARVDIRYKAFNPDFPEASSEILTNYTYAMDEHESAAIYLRLAQPVELEDSPFDALQYFLSSIDLAYDVIDISKEDNDSLELLTFDAYILEHYKDEYLRKCEQTDQALVWEDYLTDVYVSDDSWTNKKEDSEQTGQDIVERLELVNNGIYWQVFGFVSDMDSKLTGRNHGVHYPNFSIGAISIPGGLENFSESLEPISTWKWDVKNVLILENDYDEANYYPSMVIQRHPGEEWRVVHVDKNLHPKDFGENNVFANAYEELVTRPWRKWMKQL